MFEALDELDARRVKRWEAPRIGHVLPPPGTRPATADRGAPHAGPSADDMPLDADAIAAAVGPAVAARRGERPVAVEDTPATVSGEVTGDTPDEAPDETPGETRAAPPDGGTPGDGTTDDEPPARSGEAAHPVHGDAREDAQRQAFAAETATLLGSLTRARDARDSVLEDELLALARAMARLIVRRELEHDVGMMRGVVREALARLPRLSAAPVVRLHPIDATAVETAAAEGAFDTDRVVVVADRTLARGDCRVESGTTLIDAGIDAWVAAIATRHGVFEPIEAANDAPNETATSASE